MNTSADSSTVAPIEATQKVSLVDAWKIKMTREDEGHVRIRYAPLVSTVYHSPGANISSDGKTMKVTLVRCRIKEECAVEAKSESKRSDTEGLYYEVVVPWKGEKVIVGGRGPVEEELSLSQ